MCNCSHVDDLLLHFLSTRYLWRDFVCTCICIKQLIFVLLYFLHGGILLMARYMVLKHPHLGLRLRLFNRYTKKELERRCGKSLQILATLEIFLTDRSFFKKQHVFRKQHAKHNRIQTQKSQVGKIECENSSLKTQQLKVVNVEYDKSSSRGC